MKNTEIIILCVGISFTTAFFSKDILMVLNMFAGIFNLVIYLYNKRLPQ